MPITLPVSYTSIPLMQTRFPEIGSLTTLSSAALLTFAGDAEAMINAKLARYYTIPFTVLVPQLQTIATDMAVYLLMSRRLFTKEQINDSPWVDRYKEVLKELDDMAVGKTVLVDSSGQVLAGRTDIAEAYSSTMTYTPTFGEGPIENQTQDQDKLDAEDAARD